MRPPVYIYPATRTIIDVHELPAFEVLDRLEALTEEQREMVYVTAGEYKDHPSFPNTMARFSAALHELGYLED